MTANGKIISTRKRVVERTEEMSTYDMLEIIASRGGHPGALAEAGLLCIRKSADYNNNVDQTDIHNIDRTPYFPFGNISHAHMIHTKSMRFVSLVQKELVGVPPNFEGLRDTALDLINYAGFFVAEADNELR